MKCKSLIRCVLTILTLAAVAAPVRATTLRVYQEGASAEATAGPNGLDFHSGDPRAQSQISYGSGTFLANSISVVDLSLGHIGGYAKNNTAYAATSTGTFFLDLVVDNPDPSSTFTIIFAVNGSALGPNSTADFYLSYGSDPANSRHILCAEDLGGCVGNSAPITFSNTDGRLSAQLLLNAATGGVLDFLHSADIRVLAPAGVTVVDPTGLVQTVPEPSSTWLMIAGLGVVGLGMRRRLATAVSVKP